MYVKTVNPPFPGPKSWEEYDRCLVSSLAEGPSGTLVVLPGNLGLYLAYSFGEAGGEGKSFLETYKNYIRLSSSWLKEFMALHREAAARAGVYLVPGTYVLQEEGDIFLASSLISPEGDILFVQKQAFLSRLERSLGLSRGDTLEGAELSAGGGTDDGSGLRKGLRVGLIPGTDAFYPETGRILALKGADIVCHPGCLERDAGPWVPVAGMWQQVQQNQFFCVESQLCGDMAGKTFGASSLIHGPCEMTPGQTGILAGGEKPGEAATAFLHNEERLNVIKKYSLLGLLNPAAYNPLMPSGEGETLP